MDQPVLKNRTFDELTIGESASLMRIVGRDDIDLFATVSGDVNPAHLDAAFAATDLFGHVVAHGMWTMGAALRIVTDWVGDPSKVVSYFVRFVAPVPVPDDDQGTTVRVCAKVSAVSDDLITIAIEATHGDDKVLGAAKAEVRRK